jgi:hypothetical protein
VLGLGYEANPRLLFINDAPEWVFPIFLAQATFIGGVGYLAHIEATRGFMRAYYMTAGPLAGYLVHKAMVVANNIAVGVGYEGLDYYLSEAVKLFMVLGGLAYGFFNSVIRSLNGDQSSAREFFNYCLSFSLLGGCLWWGRNIY